MDTENSENQLYSRAKRLISRLEVCDQDFLIIGGLDCSPSKLIEELEDLKDEQSLFVLKIRIEDIESALEQEKQIREI